MTTRQSGENDGTVHGRMRAGELSADRAEATRQPGEDGTVSNFSVMEATQQRPVSLVGWGAALTLGAIGWILIFAWFA